MRDFDFKRKRLQIDLFGLSVELIAEDGTEYFFYLLEHGSFKSCYVKQKKRRKKKWSESELVRGNLEKQAVFRFSEQNEFGFVLN